MTYVLTGCWTTSAFVIDAHDGKVEVILQGLKLTEIGSSSPGFGVNTATLPFEPGAGAGGGTLAGVLALDLSLSTGELL
jgi:hypothetical protein